MFKTICLASALLAGSAQAQISAQFTESLGEGATEIRGVLRGSSRIDVQFCELNSDRILTLKAGTAVPTDANGGFAATLEDPLVAGERVQVQQETSPAATSCSAAPLGPPTTVRASSDWGRTRVTLAAGTVLSNDNNFQGQSLSQASLFLDFQLEKNWLWGGVNPDGNWYRRFLAVSFFEGRLTNVPESQQTASVGSVASGAADGVATFVGSQKSALMAAGAYFPFLVTKWTWRNAPHSLFVAPIAKAGFLTPIRDNESGAVEPVNPQPFDTMYSWGGRLGHYRLSFDRNEAPELVSYLDITMGRFSNLATLVPVPQPGDATPLTRPVRRFRLAAEGAVSIPSTPLIIGFSANIGQNLSRSARTRAAADDLRFFFGAKFDVGKLLGKIPLF